MMLLPPPLPPLDEEQQQAVRKKPAKATANTRDTSDGAVDEEAPARAAFARSQAVKALVRGFYSEVSKHRIAFPSHEARYKAFLSYKMASLKAAGCTSFVNNGLSCSLTQLKEVWDQHDQHMQQKYASVNTSHTTTTKKKSKNQQRIKLPMSHKVAQRVGPNSTTTSPHDAMDNSAATALISLATVAGSMNETSAMNGSKDSSDKHSKKRKTQPKRDDSDEEYSDEFEWTDEES